MLQMRFRWPDDPNRISLEHLKELDQKEAGTYIAQPKYDGWRRPAYLFDDGWKFFAKRGTGEEAAKQPPEDLVKEFSGLNWPSGIALDMEWIGPRCKEHLDSTFGPGYNGFRIFDMLYMEGKWIGGMPFRERLKNLETIFSLATKGREDVLDIDVAPWTDRGLLQMFLDSKKDPLLEGIVVKRSRSRLEGHPTKASKNPQWFKVKYRDIKEKALF